MHSAAAGLTAVFLMSLAANSKQRLGHHTRATHPVQHTRPAALSSAAASAAWQQPRSSPSTAEASKLLTRMLCALWQPTAQHYMCRRSVTASGCAVLPWHKQPSRTHCSAAATCCSFERSLQSKGARRGVAQVCTVVGWPRPRASAAWQQLQLQNKRHPPLTHIHTHPVLPPDTRHCVGERFPANQHKTAAALHAPSAHAATARLQVLPCPALCPAARLPACSTTTCTSLLARACSPWMTCLRGSSSPRWSSLALCSATW